MNSWKNDVNVGNNRQKFLKAYTDCLSFLIFLRWPFLTLLLLPLYSSSIIAPFSQYGMLLNSSSIFSNFLYPLKQRWCARILRSLFTVCFPCVITSAPRVPPLTSFFWAVGLIFTSLLPIITWMCFRHLRLCQNKVLPSPPACSFCVLICWVMYSSTRSSQRVTRVLRSLPVSFHSIFKLEAFHSTQI